MVRDPFSRPKRSGPGEFLGDAELMLLRTDTGFNLVDVVRVVQLRIGQYVGRFSCFAARSPAMLRRLQAGIVLKGVHDVVVECRIRPKLCLPRCCRKQQHRRQAQPGTSFSRLVCMNDSFLRYPGFMCQDQGSCPCGMGRPVPFTASRDAED